MRHKMNEYIRIWDNKNRTWIYEHRRIMEELLCRKLTSEEHVHHINGVIRDNRIENLEVVTKREHMKRHRPMRCCVTKKCSINGCNNKHHAKGLCKTHYRKSYPEKHYSHNDLMNRHRCYAIIMQGSNPCPSQI